MSMTNPSTEAREAANETLANIMRKHIEDAARAEALAARLQSALSASAARVKELETLMHRMIDASDKASDENPDEVREEARETLSIKVGETK